MISAGLFLATLLQASPAAPVPPVFNRDCRIEIRADMDAADYARTNGEMRSAGLTLDREAVSGTGAEPRFAALWSNAPGTGWSNAGTARVSLGAHGYDAFYRASLDMIGKDYRMADLTVGVVDGAPYYSALWEQGRAGQQSVEYWLSEAELHKALLVKDRNILAIAPFEAGGRLYFAALFEAGSSASAGRVGLDLRALDRTDGKMAARHLVRYRAYAYQAGGKTRYAAIWRAPILPDYRVAPPCSAGVPAWAEAAWK